MVKSHWAIFVILLTSEILLTSNKDFPWKRDFVAIYLKPEMLQHWSRPSTSFLERNFKQTVQFSKFVTSFNFYATLNVYFLSHIAQRSEIDFFRKYT